MVAVKICGVRTVEIASLCAEAGAGFGGLNFVPTARRRVDPENVAAIRRALGAVSAVGVFRDASYADIVHTVDTAQLDWVQLHGAEPPDFCARLREERVRVIKAIPVTPTLTADLARYHDVVDAVLLDAQQPGSGTLWSWESVAQSHARQTYDGDSSRPLLFVAGGLTPDNVAAAITMLVPDGVDVASGVESGGAIDPAKVRAFCAAVRSLQPI